MSTLTLCLTSREPRPVDPASPLGRGLAAPAATVAVFEGQAPNGLRVLFAAEVNQMWAIPDDEEGHPHVEIEEWQAFAKYPAN